MPKYVPPVPISMDTYIALLLVIKLWIMVLSLGMSGVASLGWLLNSPGGFDRSGVMMLASFSMPIMEA